MKAFLSLLLAGATALAISTPSYAGKDLDAIKASGVFKVGTEGTYPPFTYHDQANKLTGFDVDIAREVAHRLNVKPEFMEVKWDGLIAGLDAKRFDAVINQVGVTPEREAKYSFSIPYTASQVVLITRDNNSDIKTFADIKGKRSAQSLTSNYGQLATSNGAHLVSTDGFNQAIDLVATGRADATLNDRLSFLDFKKQRPDAPVKIVAQQADASKSAVLLRKGDPELVAAINKALQDLKDDGTYARISEKYFGTDISK
ncbi:amino acid ABC transporter substrate-binding protein [Xenorhabdus bovienii]|uniref:Cysteine transport protein (ABC superfamily,peri_bind) n=1 Tax=Xenorhabdus bovienii str. kraussei Quebec TaxID=1398203 RepID=A0A077PC73_XENBV|nr:amino acid ABC transporter substrate-binding protein [Xenorhabdus bovienii]MDE9495077.1 amino acid ABC transporter substrate-binding protein [Xenorhabdus bovienii]MDE9503471.1 amino acid ABC transporter substrate-binding protein [Xenorhabdus bovienii]MDE9527194.1 amino acid ABC transporter substrate-binding protein [Xenorhabdus bovienii]MDE9570300.1 amino acid ABC transporter substrate-binding protein [Xenorhabdus bovienii]CDH22080.1 cysteine transport protein (ABC superfamily,peri_bind) [X